MKWKIKSLGQLPLHGIYRYVRYDRDFYTYLSMAVIQLILRFKLIVGFFWEVNLARFEIHVNFTITLQILQE